MPSRSGDSIQPAHNVSSPSSSADSYRFVAWHGSDDVELSARDPDGRGGSEIHLVRGHTGWRILGPLTHQPVTGAAG